MNTTTVLPGCYPNTPPVGGNTAFKEGDFVFIRNRPISKKVIAKFNEVYGKTLPINTWWQYITNKSHIVDSTVYVKENGDKENYYMVYTKYIGYISGLDEKAKDESYLVKWEPRNPDAKMPGEAGLTSMPYYATNLINITNITIMTPEQIVAEVISCP